jgi:hypothetical protein
MPNETIGSREWLNPDESLSCVAVGGEARQYSLDCHLTIRDCDRQVQLDFDIWGGCDSAGLAAAISARLTKIAKIRAALSLIERFIVEHSPETCPPGVDPWTEMGVSMPTPDGPGTP